MTVSQLVGRERSRLRAAIVAGGAAAALAASAALLAASAWGLGGARWITRPLAPLVAWGLVILVAGVVAWYTRRMAHRASAPHEVARAIEHERALRAGSLRAALEVANAGALGRHAADALASRLDAVGSTLAPATQRRALRGTLAALAGAVLALALVGAARAASPDGWRAVRHPIGAFTGSILPPLRITGAPPSILRGEKLHVVVRAAERLRVTLRTRTTGAAWDTVLLPVAHGVATTVLGPLDADLVLVAGDGRVHSDTVVVRVTDRPFVGDVAVRAVYPAYLQRPAETIPVGEPARVPRGTVLLVRGRASTALASVALVDARDTIALHPDGHAFDGRLTATRSARLTWVAAGAGGPIADVPAALELDVIPDSAPHVEILDPPRDTTVLPGATLALRIAAADDHGLSDVVLRSARRTAGGQRMPEIDQAIASPGTPEYDGTTTLDLSPRGLAPGDELHIVAIATDNSPWRQTAASRELVLRVPSLTEQRERARALADSTAADVEAAAKSARDLAERTGEQARSRADRAMANGSTPPSASRDAEQQHTMSYQSAENARALAREQQQLSDRVKEAQAKAEALEQQLRAAGVMDSALTQQLRDAQQMLRDALTPELQQQLADVLKATQQLSPDALRQSLQDLAAQQQRLRDALERSAAMLQRAALEGAMQTLHDEARDIAKGERAAADSLARGSTSGDSSAARDAASLSQRSRDLATDVASVAQRLAQQRARSGPSRLDTASARADSSAAAMQRAAQQASSGNADSTAASTSPRAPQSGHRGQRAQAASEGAQQMEQAAQQLGDARQSQIQEWKQELTSDLDRAIQEAMQLSRDEQTLADRARTGSDPADLRGDQSAVQQGVQRVQQRVEQDARKSAHVSAETQGAMAEAAHRVQDATRTAAQGEQDGDATSAAMQDASQALAQAVAHMVQDRARAASGQTASGFSEMIDAMRQAARQQGALNAQTAGIMPLPGGQPTASMLAQARALAQRQRDIARGLDGTNGGGSAQQLARQMRDIADALDRGQLDPSVLEQQQRLFHRLLDAGLTLQKDEREDNGKREAETARRDTAITTGTVSSGRAVARYPVPTWNELRGLSADERRAVIEYFKRINADQP